MRIWKFIKWITQSKADRLSRTCPTCGKLWPSRRALGAHKKAHRVKPPVPPPVFCKECGFRDPIHGRACTKGVPT